MGEYLDKVRKRVAQKRWELEQDPATTDEVFRNMATAEKYLRSDNAFVVYQPVYSLAVLKFLGYSEAEMKDLFYQLVYEQSTGNRYRYVDPDNLPGTGGAETKPSSAAPQSGPPDIPETDDDTDPPEEPEESPEVPEPEAAPPEEPRSNPRMGRLIYWEGGRRCQTDPLLLDPDCETYYYTKYCFGKKDAKGRLHTLVGNEWRYGGPFRSYYFDAQYDYWEVDYILEPEDKI